MTACRVSRPSPRRPCRLPAIALLSAPACLAPRVAFAEAPLRYELREELTGVLLPGHRDAVAGKCATGTGAAPAAAYAGEVGVGMGLGAGLGMRAFYQDARARSNASEWSWWGLRLGAGLDANLLYAKVPANPSKRLCLDVERTGSDVQYQDSSVLLVQVPLLLGAEVGLGNPSGASWEGVVLGWAWAPTLTVVKPWIAPADFEVSCLGTELTLDFGATRGVGAHEGKRVAVFLLLPVLDGAPTVLTLSFGAAWY